MSEEDKYLSLDSEEVEEVRIVSRECGYMSIEVTTKNGENFLVESD